MKTFHETKQTTNTLCLRIFYWLVETIECVKFGRRKKKERRKHHIRFSDNGYELRVIEAFNFFDGIIKLGLRPDQVTSLVVLAACSHCDLVNEEVRCYCL